MSRTNIRRLLMTCCTAATLLSAASPSWAECALTDWLFGHGQTTYAPAYSPPNVCAPAAPACGCAPTCAPTCGCAPALPACQSCAPTATYRISYRPVPTVAYMPVVGVDPCSGCAVTTYAPTRVWTYKASLLPYSTYQAAYVPAVAGCGSCGSCGGCAPCSGYASSCGGCSSCGTSYGGCSSCGMSYGGCSSCTPTPAPLSGTHIPGPGDMSQPPVLPSPLTAPSTPAMIGPPAAPPAAPSSSEPSTYGPGSAEPKTFVPGANGAPILPSAPGASSLPSAPGASSSGTLYHSPASVEPLKIQNIPPVPSGPQLSPAPELRPEIENRTTSRPVLQARYFQLLPSPPASVPVQAISVPPQPVDDGGWQHAGN